VYSDIEGRLSRTERARMKSWGCFRSWGGTQNRRSSRSQIGQHWKKLLFALMEDLAESSPAVASSSGTNYRSLSTK